MCNKYTYQDENEHIQQYNETRLSIIIDAVEVIILTSRTILNKTGGSLYFNRKLGLEWLTGLVLTSSLKCQVLIQYFLLLLSFG